MSYKSQWLFVYGTLAPGRANAHLLDDIYGEWHTGWVNGHLHKEGWGYTMGYPALVLDPDGPRIKGHVLKSNELHKHWPRLDAFEGEEYRRLNTPVHLDSGQVVEASLFVLNNDEICA